jgi:hypothetical protein
MQDNNVIIEPTPGSTLIRTRLFLQFRILNYPLTGDVILPTQWWQDMQPFYGIYVDDPVELPETGGDPIGDTSPYPWVIWGVGVGSLDAIQPDPDFAPLLDTTYVWNMPGGISESRAERKTTVGHHPAMYLNWNWQDRSILINQAHGSYPIAYDLSVNYGVDTLWELPAS